MAPMFETLPTQGADTGIADFRFAALANFRSKLTKLIAAIRTRKVQRVGEIHPAGHPIQRLCNAYGLFDRHAGYAGQAA